MLNFPSNALPEPLERFLTEVHNGSGQALKMPIALRWGGALGGAVHGLQVVGTWAQLEGANRTLSLPTEFSDQENTRERFASTLPGMAALYFSESIKCGERSFSRHKALEAVAPRVSAMQDGTFQDTLRGQGVALCCFAGARNEYLTPLYARSEPGGVRELSAFRVLLPRLISSVGVETAKTLSEGQLDYLAALTYQLFLNSEEHGAYSANGERLPESMRGVVLRLTSLQKVSELVKFAGDDSAFRSYLSRLAIVKSPRLEEDQQLPSGAMQVLEISVFDTGPGLALRWLSQHGAALSYEDFSLEDEQAAVETCFQKHATTKASQHFGLGLPVALAGMRKLGAFMTLRTGRLSLYQDFARRDTEAFEPKARFARKRISRVAGTAYTICFRVK